VLAHALVTRWRRPRASPRKTERWASLRSLFLSVRPLYTPPPWRTPDGKSASEVAAGTSRATTESASALSRRWPVNRSPPRPTRRGRSVKRSRSLSPQWTALDAETLARGGETSARERALRSLRQRCPRARRGRRTRKAAELSGRKRSGPEDRSRGPLFTVRSSKFARPMKWLKNCLP